jgi:hypothetical protein
VHLIGGGVVCIKAAPNDIASGASSVRLTLLPTVDVADGDLGLIGRGLQSIERWLDQEIVGARS